MTLSYETILEQIKKKRREGQKEYNDGHTEFTMMRNLEALELAKKHNLKEEAADILVDISFLHAEWGNTYKVRQACEQGLKYAEKPNTKAKLMMNLANQYAVDHKLEKAREITKYASRLKVSPQLQGALKRNLKSIDNATMMRDNMIYKKKPQKFQIVIKPGKKKRRRR